MLSSVHASRTSYSTVIRRQKLLSEVFSVSDEAFALLMVQNYIQKWEHLYKRELMTRARDTGQYTEEERLQDPHLIQDKQVWRNHKHYQARWSSSKKGFVKDGWGEVAMKMFGIHARKIEKLRAKGRNGRNLEIALRAHFGGLDNTGKDVKENEKQGEDRVRPYTDPGLWGTFALNLEDLDETSGNVVSLKDLDCIGGTDAV